jgi:hypothetical protein
MSFRHAKFKTTPPLVTRLIVRLINKTNDLKYDKGEYKTLENTKLHTEALHPLPHE